MDQVVDPDVEAPVSRLSDFEILRTLGAHDGITSYLAEKHGAFGFVKRVMLKVADRPVGEGRDVALRLSDEARLGMRLFHPNLLQTLDLGRDEDRFFLVREWVEGVGLRRLMHRTWGRGESLPTTAVLRIAIGICRVLDYLHGLNARPWAPAGIVHRGVAPSNILLSYAGEVRLANLFMARGPGRRAAGAPHVGGMRLIPAFTAPEVAAGRRAEPTADVFGIGVVLYECLLGPDSLGGATDSDWQRSRDDETMARALEAAEIGDDLREVLLRATHPDPELRYVSAAHLKDDLRLILKDRFRADGDDALRDLVAAAATPDQSRDTPPRSKP
jgi:serine/threonine protein kinase